VTTLPLALAVIDGSLAQLSREGIRARRYEPLATAVIEFRQGPMCIVVVEHPYGLLPGMPNLYCLDAELRLQWLADWPEQIAPCSRIINVTTTELLAESAEGDVLKFDVLTGQFRGVSSSLSAVG
jgi:hypothetical protein